MIQQGLDKTALAHPRDVQLQEGILGARLQTHIPPGAAHLPSGMTLVPAAALLGEDAHGSHGQGAPRCIPIVREIRGNDLQGTHGCRLHRATRGPASDDTSLLRLSKQTRAHLCTSDGNWRYGMKTNAHNRAATYGGSRRGEHCRRYAPKGLKCSSPGSRHKTHGAT